MLAAESRNVEVVRFLLDNGADVACCNNDMFTALHKAAKIANNVDVLRLLIDRGVDVNARDRYDRLPIDLAAGVANFRFLMEAGTDPERALVAAAASQFDEIVGQLIDSGVDVDARGGSNGWSALQVCCATRSSAHVLFSHLLVCGADVKVFSTDRKWNALRFAINRGCAASCARLLAADADVHTANLHGDAPLHFALRTVPYNCLSLLLAAGADIGTVDKNFLLGTDDVHTQCLLVAAGATGCPVPFTEEELCAAQAEIAAAKEKIDAARRQLKAERHKMVVKKALPMCIGQHSFELPAYVTLAVLDQVLPGRLSELVPMSFKWDVIAAVKHFHES